MGRNNAPNFVSGGNILPCHFVKVSTTADNTVLVATDGSTSHGDITCGISQEGVRNPPGLIYNLTGSESGTVYAAIAGDPIEVFSEGDVCLLVAGSGGWTSGDKLKSDSAGGGISASAGDNVGAFAMSTVNSGEKGRVQIISGTGKI